MKVNCLPHHLAESLRYEMLSGWSGELAMLLLAQGDFPSGLAQYGLPGIGLAALAIVVRVLFKQVQDDYKAERARADRLEAQLTRFAEDERKRYGELIEAMKTVGEVLVELRADERRRR